MHPVTGTILGVACVVYVGGVTWAGIKPYFFPRINVIDGDTITRGGVHYRLVGYDTAEMRHPHCIKELGLAHRATVRLREMVKEGVEFKQIPGNCAWGRKCASLTYNDHDVGDILISEGLAHRLICPGGICPPKESWC